jgi:hypothetical protein
MMTAGEDQATGAALETLAQEVDAARAAYWGARNWLSLVGIEDQITRDARDAYEVKLGLYNALLAARKELEVGPDYDHEKALMVVDLATNSAERKTADAIREMVASNDPLSIAARATIQTVQQAGTVLQVGVPIAIVVLIAVLVVKGK